MLRTLGTTVSSYQPSIDWPAAAAQGVRFAICRATRGEHHVDPMFEKHATDAAADAILVGSAHGFQTDGDPITQALSYFAVAGALATDLPPVIDFGAVHGDTPTEEAIAGALDFIEATEQLWSRGCVVRTSPAFWSLLGSPEAPEIGKRALWIAHRRVASPTIPAPWSKWLLWHFDGDGGRILPHGVVADFHWFEGDEEMLRLYCKWRMPALPLVETEAPEDGAAVVAASDPAASDGEGGAR